MNFFELAEKVTLYGYQDDIVTKVVQSPSYALFVEMGLGKTIMALSVAFMRVLRGEVKRILILCPKTIAKNWQETIEWLRKMYGFYFTIDVRDLSSKTTKEVAQELNSLERFKYDVVIDILNFEKLLYLEELPKYDFLIIDESTRIKNPNAQRTQKVLSMLKHTIPFRLVLTGSPITKDVSDLWTQLYLVDAVDIPYKDFRKAVRKDKSKWREYARKNIIALTKEDIERMGLMKFPEKVYKTYRFELSDEAKLYYLKVQELMQKSIIVSDMRKVLATMIQMQRVTSGFNPFNLKEFAQNRKKELLGILVKRGLIPRPFIVWATFVRDVQVVYAYLKQLGLKGELVYGDVPNQRRGVIIDNFQAGKYDFLVAHPVVMGIGVTLTASNCCIYYSNSFRFEDRIQSEDRIHRVNQTADKCYYIDLVAKNTIDEVILENLKNKRSLSDLTIDEMKELVEIGKAPV